MEAENDGSVDKKMTDEEREKLCAELRELGRYNSEGDLRFKAADEIERLADERDQFAEQLAIRSETGMAKDMQEIMRINNELSEQLALAQSDAGPGSPWAIISRYESTAKKLRKEPTLLSDEEKIEWMEEFCEELRTALVQSDPLMGLIEASISEDLVELANNEYWRDRQGPKMSDDRRKFENEKMWRTLKTVFRACAADRSMK